MVRIAQNWRNITSRYLCDEKSKLFQSHTILFIKMPKRTRTGSVVGKIGLIPVSVMFTEVFWLSARWALVASPMSLWLLWWPPTGSSMFMVVVMLLMYSVLHCLYSVGNKITTATTTLIHRWVFAMLQVHELLGLCQRFFILCEMFTKTLFFCEKQEMVNYYDDKCMKKWLLRDPKSKDDIILQAYQEMEMRSVVYNNYECCFFYLNVTFLQWTNNTLKESPLHLH